MKMIRDKLMMCAAFVGLISGAVEAADQAKTVRLKSGREMLIPTPEQSAVVRDAEYYVHIQKKLDDKINQYSQEAAACSKMKCNTLRWLVTKLPSASVAYGILHASYE